MAYRRVQRTKDGLNIGVSTLFLLGSDFDGVIRAIRKSSVQSWEIFDDGSHSLDEKKVRRILRVSKSREISYTVHGPICDLNLATLNPQLRGLVVKRLKKSLVNAASLGAARWVLHPGTHGALSWVRLGEDWDVNLRNLREIEQFARALKVEVGIENISAGLAILGHVKDFLRLYRDWPKAPQVAFDVGHAHIKREIDEFISRLGSRIIHVHAHDNHGDTDRHLSIGSGTVRWRKVLRSLLETGFEGQIVIESAKAPFASHRKIEDLVRSLK